MITKSFVSYFYMQIKYKSIIVYIKNKKRRNAYIMVSKGTLQFKYVSKEYTKQTKANEEGWYKRRKSFKLHNQWNILSISLSVYFSSYKLAKDTLKCFLVSIF